MKMNKKTALALICAATVAVAASNADGAKAVVGNPISALIGRPVGDTHMIEWKGRVYLFAGHDFALESKGYDLRDWWVWSSSDLLEWKLESVLKPEDTFLKRPFKSCWATFGVPFPDGWRYYFSAGPTEIGVVTAKTPAGPWSDPLGKPLVAKGEYRTQARDPDVLLDDDGSAYIVFGTFKYFIAKLGADGLSLAEKARPVEIKGEFGPYGQGKTDDKPSLHKRNGLYYLSWSSFYAVSENVYGPYRYRGSVIDAAYVAPKFRRDRIELHYDRHGNFFQFNGQWYYVANDYSQPGRTRFFRDAVMGYVHYRDNGDIAPVRIDEVGVGQYDASRGEIEAEDFFAAAHGRWQRRAVSEHPQRTRKRHARALALGQGRRYARIPRGETRRTPPWIRQREAWKSRPFQEVLRQVAKRARHARSLDRRKRRRRGTLPYRLARVKMIDGE